jgi:hypothetical protein
VGEDGTVASRPVCRAMGWPLCDVALPLITHTTVCERDEFPVNGHSDNNTTLGTAGLPS